MTVTRYEEPISSVEMLVNSNLRWGGATVDYYTSVMYTDNPNLHKFVEGFFVCYDDLDDCAKPALELKMALALELLQYGN